MTDVLAALAAQSRGHSIFSPSSAATWMTCAGSLVPNAMAPDKASFESAEGTVAHAMADQWLRSGVRPVVQTVEEDGFVIEVDEGMLAYVEQYVDWVQECPGEMYFETRVDLSSLFPIPNQGGTADHFSCTWRRLTITDLKYGKGIRVYAAENPQLMLYAYGVFLEWDWFYDFQQIDIRVCQPRLDHFDTWTVDRDSLLAFADRVRERAVDCWTLDAPRTPSEKGCQWCKVQRGCPAYLNWFAACADAEADVAFGTGEMARAAEEAADLLSDQLPIVLPELSIEACARILPMRHAVEKWFAEIEARLFAAAADGDVPGYKIVEGRSTRAWADEAEAEARMREVGIADPFTKKLMSPNQAEEALHAATRMPKKKAAALLESHTERAPGVRTLVRSDDKRNALPNYGDILTGKANG